jgi:hypothetical protein
MAHAYNPNCLRGGDQEDGGLRPAWAQWCAPATLVTHEV